MPIDPIHLTKNLRESYLEYLQTSFHLKDQTFFDQFQKKIQEFQFLKGPILEATPPFKPGEKLANLIESGDCTYRMDQRLN